MEQNSMDRNSTSIDMVASVALNDLEDRIEIIDGT